MACRANPEIKTIASTVLRAVPMLIASHLRVTHLTIVPRKSPVTVTFTIPKRVTCAMPRTQNQAVTLLTIGLNPALVAFARLILTLGGKVEN